VGNAIKRGGVGWGKGWRRGEKRGLERGGKVVSKIDRTLDFFEHKIGERKHKQ
jgi:hypothetical protein